MRTGTLTRNSRAQTLQRISNGYKAVSDAETAYNKAVEAYDKALKQAQPQNAELNQRVKEAQRYMEDMKAEYDEISAKKTTYDAAKDEVVSAETALETLVKTSKLDNLELSRMAKQIQNLKAPDRPAQRRPEGRKRQRHRPARSSPRSTAWSRTSMSPPATTPTRPTPS